MLSVATKPKPAAPVEIPPYIPERRVQLPGVYPFVLIQASLPAPASYVQIAQLVPGAYLDTVDPSILVLPAEGAGSPTSYRIRIGSSDYNLVGAVLTLSRPFPGKKPGTGGGGPPVITPPVVTVTNVAINATAQNEGTTVARTAIATLSTGATPDVSTLGVWSVPAPYSFSGNLLTVPANSVTGDSTRVELTFTYLGVAYKQVISIVDKTVVVTPPPSAADTTPATSPTVQLVYDGSRAYSDSNTNDKAFTQLFDGDTGQNAEAGNPITPTWKQTYPFYAQQRTRLDYVLLRDQNGVNAAPGIEYVYGLVGETTEYSLGFFIGPNFGAWQRLDFPVLTKAVAYVRSRHTTGQFQPAEIQFYGAQVAYTPPVYQPGYPAFAAGVNGNWYDFVTTGNATTQYPYGSLNPAVYTPMDHLGMSRLYVDQNDIIRRTYTGAVGGPEIARIAPAYHGENYDLILADRKQKGYAVRLVVINLKASLAATWPNYVDYNPYVPAHTDAQGNQVPEQLPQPWLNDNTIQPRDYNADPQNPATWKPIGQVFFNLTARYGKVAVAPSRTWWSTTKLNSYDTAPPVNINGLDLLDGLEVCNELNEYYKGISQYLSVRDEAMMASVIKDGHKGAVTGDFCMAAADPNMKLYSMGPSRADSRRYRALMAEFARIRGYRADGSIDCPYDMQCFHEYPRKPENGAGVPLELSDSLPKIVDLRQAQSELQPGQKLSLGEIGYADQADATGYANGFVQGYSYCPPSASFTTPQRIAHWNLRNILVALAAGVDEVLLYTANRIAPPNAVNPNWDTVNGLRNSPTEFHLAGTRGLLTGYGLQGYVQNPTNVAGQARVQKWTAQGKPDIYVVWMGSLEETTAPFVLSLPGVTQLTKCVPQDAAVKLLGTTQAVSGTYSGTATEQPTLYYVGVPSSTLVAFAP